ncbi:hypothetical protein CRG98_016399, partial [Punica granatum]
MNEHRTRHCESLWLNIERDGGPLPHFGTQPLRLSRYSWHHSLPGWLSVRPLDSLLSWLISALLYQHQVPTSKSQLGHTIRRSPPFGLDRPWCVPTLHVNSHCISSLQALCCSLMATAIAGVRWCPLFSASQPPKHGLSSAFVTPSMRPTTLRILSH